MRSVKAGHASPRRKYARVLTLLAFLAVGAGIVFGSWIYETAGQDSRRDLVGRIRSQLLSQRQSNNAPVNILLIGSDSRDGESGRSDTLILMTVNYQQRRVYVVSIPRDTHVNIPGYGADKINAAYAYGQTVLAIETVEDFMGVDLNHFVEVDFEGFKQLVDTLGGIDITVRDGINDNSAQYGMHIPAGPQSMDGETALNYVRYRHGDSDFGRAQRQQDFLRALADNALRPRTILKLPKLIGIFDDSVTTDMSRRQMVVLAHFLNGVSQTRIETVTVAGESKVINGISFVEPNPAFLVELMNRIESGRSIEPMKSSDESGKMLMEY